MTPMQRTVGKLLLDHPFFGAMAFRLKISPGQVETAETDGVAIRYNAEWFQSLTPAEQQGLVAHELLHISLSHSERMQGRDSRQWNNACDYAINETLRECGFTLPQGVLLNREFRGMCAEQIYPRIASESKSQPWGKIVPPPPGTRKDSLQKRVEIAQAIQHAQKSGGLPNCLERALSVSHSKISWKDLLNQFVSQIQEAGNRTSWHRPNRRYAWQGLYLPYTQGDLLEIIVVIDTSGSINRRLLSRFLAEIAEILRTYQAIAWVVQCDAAVHQVDRVVDCNALSDITIRGGGGTKFGPGLDYWNTCPGNPACLIYFTDLLGTIPQRKDFPVLWASTRKTIAPWGQTITIKEET